MKISEVYEGWRNVLIPPEDLKEVINSVYAKRLEICEGCEFHSKNFETIRMDDHCTKCGCPLMSKLKCLSCACPLKESKWSAVNMKE